MGNLKKAVFAHSFSGFPTGAEIFSLLTIIFILVCHCRNLIMKHNRIVLLRIINRVFNTLC
ncbi:hypothetical protein ACO2J1_04820 [Leptospira interrogans]|uniref:hypothetical protein n=1 Tax=Leptospira TaxID=171 RepID=UPI0002BFCFE2|nr:MULTISPECIES: hypothetical protein [Leptospira]EMN76328.1 hypothetical protein LEP1GSC102_2301 [Leptospira interrogans str. UI 09600]EMN80094.1 hypothetical protein LEP1GSC106_4289 [Leptospira interrogans serovar Grippotyphosa str. UI 12764]ASV07562.1 hypothetical protein B2G47_00565 [Leptospira interrogans serovar Canicola]OLZ33022.1 hypothetical protein AR546_02685 [Leptospira interrogans serovar Canicola]OMH73419.1 hypothetical protein BW243_00565 [Leptospira interrogans serovar Pomona]